MTTARAATPPVPSKKPLGPLTAGDTVAVIATAGASPPDAVQRAVELLLSWGLKVQVGESVTARHPRASYLSAPDAVRAHDLTEAWCDEQVRAIFCIRGGYGSIRMLDLLDGARMSSATPKPIYGSSDVTALHEWLRENLHTSTWFTPMVGTKDLLDDETATKQLHRAVFDTPSQWTSPSAETMFRGTAEGTLIGGNLSLLAATLAANSRARIDNTGNIVLLEDITEDPYRLDGYLQQLLRSGWFKGVTGVALGSWKDCGPLDDVRALMHEALEPLNIPVVWELGFGHCAAAHSIPLGVAGRLIADAQPRLELA